MAVGIGNFIDRIQLGSNEEAQIIIGSSAYGVCTTAANEANKTVNIPGFVLQNHNGTTLQIRFQNNNTALAPTLNVTNTGDIPIISYAGTPAGTNDDTTGWHAGAVLSLTYDSTTNAWIRHSNNNTNTIYDNLTASENGTDVSLVTTGEKYIWNNKSNINQLTLGAGIAGSLLLSSGEIKVDLRDYTPLLDSSATNNTILPVVLDSDSHLAVQLQSSSGIVSSLIVGLNNSTINTANNTNHLYIRLFNNNDFNSEIQLIGGNNIIMTSDANGAITISAIDTTYSVFTNSTNGLVPAPDNQGDGTRFLREDGTWITPRIPLASSTTVGGIKIGFSTLSPKVYAVELDENGMAYVSVPWDTNTDTMVTQTETTENNAYELLFSNSTTNTTLTETARKSSHLVFNPSTSALIFSDGEATAAIGPITYTGTATNVTGIVSVEHGGTGVTSVSAIKTLLNYTPADLGLANALHFIGKATTPIVDGSNTDPDIENYDFTNSKQYGDVIIDSTNAREYVWTYENKWELLGQDASEVYSITTTGNQWIGSITQLTDRTIQVTTKELDTTGRWLGQATTALYLSSLSNDAYTPINVGDIYTPVYFSNGIPVTCTPSLLYINFVISQNATGVTLPNSTFTATSYVLNIVITNGIQYLNSPISWSSSEGSMAISCTATSGEVTGYLIVSKVNLLQIST